MSDELVAFLKAQLDAEEQVAQAAANRMPPTWNPPGQKRLAGAEGDYALSAGRGYEQEVFGQVWDVRDGPVAVHIARWDPARVLAEVQAKRRLINLCRGAIAAGEIQPGTTWNDNAAGAAVGREVLRLLALPYAGRDGCREEWAADWEKNHG